MTGLMIKDFLVSKKYLRTVLLLFGFFAIFGLATQDGTYILFMAPIFFTMMTITTFAYDTAAKWDAYALSMPISRSDMVFSKYAVSLLFSVSGCVIAYAISFISGIIKGEPVTSDIAVGALAALGVSLVIISVLLPLVYKFGTEKARIMMIAVFVVPSVLSVALSKSGIPMPSEEFLKSLAVFSPFIVVVIVAASYLLSKHIFANKEL